MHTDNRRRTPAHIAALAASLALTALLVLPAPALGRELPSLSSTWEAQVEKEQGELEAAEAELAAVEQEIEEAYNPNIHATDLRNAENDIYYEQAELAAAKQGLAKEKELSNSDEPSEITDLQETIAYYEALEIEYGGVGADSEASEARAELEGSAFSPGLYGQLEELQNPEPEPDSGDSGSAAPSGSDSGEAAPPAEESSGGGISLFWIFAFVALVGFGAYKIADRFGGGGLGERLREAFSPAMARAPSPGGGGLQQAAPHPGGDSQLDDYYDDDDDFDPLDDDDDPDDEPEPDDAPEDGPGDGGRPSRLPPDEEPPDEDPKPEPAPTGGGNGQKGPLETYTRSYADLAATGDLDAVIGREDEVDSAIEILNRTKKGNPVLLGEAGVGKTAVVEGLAQRIYAGEARGLEGREILELNLGALEAGTKLRGEYEERLQAVISAVEERPEVIFFIDELHRLGGSGGTEGSPATGAQMLKPALARDGIRVIGATTPDEYRQGIEKDPAMERRFSPVRVEPLTVEQTVEVLRLLREDFEAGKLSITDEALQVAAEYSERYIPERNLPDKAIDLVDTAASRAKIDGRREVGEPEIRVLIKKQTGIDPGAPDASEGERLRELQGRLGERVVGQPEAVSTVARAIAASRYMPDDSKPVSFLFAGPSGVGKTELAKAIASEQFGSEAAMVRIDMSEYQEQHRVANLVGAARGFIGSEKGGDLTEPVRRQPYSVVLLDEIEKAHPQVLTILLQVLDDGRLTDNSGRTVSFRNAIVIMTTNAGAQEIAAASAAGKAAPVDKVKEALIRHGVRPEWVGRVGYLCPFAPLSEEALQGISRIALRRAASRASRTGVTLTWTPEAADLIAALGHNPAFGARPLLEVVQRQVVEALTDMLMRGELAAGDEARVEASKSEPQQLIIRKAPPEDDPAKDPGPSPGRLPPDEDPPEEE